MRRRFLNNGCSPINIDDFFTIYALYDNLQVSLNNDLEYCIDGDGEWIFLSNNELTKPIKAGQTVSFKGDCIVNSSTGIGIFTITQPCNLQGNISSIVKSLDVNANVPSRMFYCLFWNTPIIDVHKLVVPFLKLNMECYSCMFANCTSLTTAPELPATTLTLADYCYSGMFKNCTSLTTAPELPATTLAYSCYDNMFNGCTSLTTAPELPATTLAPSCYHSMFYGCRSLTTAPELPATILKGFCYYRMFYYCHKLNYIKMLATDIPDYTGNHCLTDWVYGVASKGAFVKNPAMNSLPTGTSGIPRGWTVVNDREESDGNEITFYIYDEVETIPMKALSNMTWWEFVNSEYANQNSMLINFRLDDYGSYNSVRFYHEGAMQDMTLYYDDVHYNNVADSDVIEDGRTYYAW